MKKGKYIPPSTKDIPFRMIFTLSAFFAYFIAAEKIGFSALGLSPTNFAGMLAVVLISFWFQILSPFLRKYSKQ